MADIYSFPEWRKVDEEVKRPDVITSEENRDLNEEMLKMVKALSAIDEDGDYDGDCIPESIQTIMQGIEEYFWLKRDYYASKYVSVPVHGKDIVGVYFRIGRNIREGKPVDIFPCPKE